VLMLQREMNILMDDVRLLVLLQLVELLLIMLDVILLNSQLTKFLTVKGFKHIRLILKL